ncbi:nuclear transport factor 2 family protein [Streptomyces sp. NPDC085927]|uniref:nuclear transport factor 2 family protein n=1 Tax=Streptomyces sp. NPDC085927 TaxID=3365738 RepID=UPI0037D76E4D
MSGDAVEARIARLEALAEIRTLPVRYAHHYAGLDMDALAGLYADPLTLRTGEASSREALRASFERSGAPPDGVRMAVLHTGNHIVRLTDDGRAVGSVYCRAEVQRGDGSFFHQAIHYGDHYCHQDGAWRFERQRDHELFYGAPPATPPNSLPPANWPERDTGRGTFPPGVADGRGPVE